MNVITQLTTRIEEYRASNKNPCKNYATEAAAEKATAAMAARAGVHFSKSGKAARYVVFFIPAWGRWVGAVDMTEMMSRQDFQGGYLGFCTGFYTY